MRWLNTFLILLLFVYSAHGQTTRVIHGDTVIINRTDAATSTLTSKQTGEVETFRYVDQLPQAPYDVNAYLAKNIRYPKNVKESGFAGKVIVKFIIDIDGSIDSPRVLKQIPTSIEKEVIRVVKSMPAWEPAIQNGKPIRCPFTLPIYIHLD